MAALVAIAGKALVTAKGIGTILSGVGTAVSSVGALRAGAANQASANYTAAQLEASAKTERASAQREAQEERRQKELMISRARAVGAASGGGQDLQLLGDIEEDGELRAMTAMWQGEEAAVGKEQEAVSERFTGKSQRKAGAFKAGTTLLSGASSLYDRYN